MDSWILMISASVVPVSHSCDQEDITNIPPYFSQHTTRTGPRLQICWYIFMFWKMSCHRIPNPSWIVSLLFPAKEITICKGTLSKGRREFTVICKLHLRRTENLRQHKANSRVSCQNRATFNIHVSIQDASLHNVYCSHQIHMFST